MNFYCNAKNVEELESWLKQNLEIVKRFSNPKGKTSEYTTLVKGKILLFEQTNSWKEALNLIGKKYEDFREKKKNEIFKTPAFGMPVMHNRFTMRLVPYKNSQNRLSDRWASPVIFKVIRGNEIYFPVIVILNPGGIKWIGKEKKDRDWTLEEIKEVDWSILDDFKKILKPIKELAL